MKKLLFVLALLVWCSAFAFGQSGSGTTAGGCTSCTGGILVSTAGDLQINGKIFNAGTLVVNPSLTLPTGSITLTVGSVIAAGGIQGANSTTLTEGAATSFASFAVASNSYGAIKITYVVHADDGTDFQARAGELFVAVVNKAGTLTCTLFRAQGSGTVDNTTDNVAVSAGTLTHTFTCVTATNSVLIKDSATSSLTQTTLAIQWRADVISGTGTITAQ